MSTPRQHKNPGQNNDRDNRNANKGSGRRSSNKSFRPKAKKVRATHVAFGEAPQESLVGPKIRLNWFASPFFRISRVLGFRLPGGQYNLITGSFPRDGKVSEPTYDGFTLDTPTSQHSGDHLTLLTVMSTPAGTFWWESNMDELVISSVEGTLKEIRPTPGKDNVWIFEKGKSMKVPSVIKKRNGFRVFMEPHVEVGDHVKVGEVLAGPTLGIRMSLPLIKRISPFVKKKLFVNTGLDWSETEAETLKNRYLQMSLGDFHKMSRERDADIAAARLALNKRDVYAMSEIHEGIGDIAAEVEENDLAEMGLELRKFRPHGHLGSTPYTPDFEEVLDKETARRKERPRRYVDFPSHVHASRVLSS